MKVCLANKTFFFFQIHLKKCLPSVQKNIFIQNEKTTKQPENKAKYNKIH